MATAGIMRGVMFLRHTKRKKDGKEHRYWSIVENRRVGGGRVVQRPLLYLGEINDSQELAWRKSIAVLEEGAAAPRPLSLFPEDRCEGVLPDAAVVRLKLAELRLCRPRQWGGCWLAVNLWRELALDRFWAERLIRSGLPKKYRCTCGARSRQRLINIGAARPQATLRHDRRKSAECSPAPKGRSPAS